MWEMIEPWLIAAAIVYAIVGLLFAFCSEYGHIRKSLSTRSDAAEFALWALFVMVTWPFLLYLVRND